MMKSPTTRGAPYALQPYRPARWLPGGHAQTIGGRLFRPAPPLELQRERLETPDGDFLDLDFALLPSPAGSAPAGDTARAARGSVEAEALRREGQPLTPIVLVLHGLEGSARRRYMLLAYRELLGHGIRAVGLNFRSCSGEPNRTPRLYHSGDTGDLRFVLEHLAHRFPGAPRGAIGFSLGGNVVIKFLGEESDAALSLLDAAVAISVPFDLSHAARRLEQTAMGRVYTAYFVRMLRRTTRAKASLLVGHVDLARVLQARTLREFDNTATAPLHGFADADDYYRCSSSGPFVERVRVPTLLLHAADDPFLPRAAIPHVAAQRNPHITTGFTALGGHLGFVAGPPWAPRFWAETEAARFLAVQLRR